MQSDSIRPLRQALIRLTLGTQATEELPNLAAAALAEGVDSPCLARLASVPRSEVREARDLFVCAMDELGVHPVVLPTEPLALAQYLAREILTGTIPPERGAWLIGWNAWEPGRPAELAIFMGLASMCEDDPEHRAEYQAQIIGEARRLVERDR